MPHISIFDVAGPIMIGPSSSHTAGACKIGQYARAIFHHTPSKVTFYLHGSFGEVYKGHATDRALLAGVMKFKTRDPKMKDALAIAREKGLEYKFIPMNLGEKYHPNTVKIVLENSRHKMSLIGSSIGGGMVQIFQIDNFPVGIHGVAGKFMSLVIRHVKESDVIARLIDKIEKLGEIEVAGREDTSFKDKALTVLHLRGRAILLREVIELEKIEGIDFIRSLHKLEKD
ncbi:L-serine ammonia-lyase, iron-sulfur-dependent, subunit beta [Candidatus Peregrinibacteria bacterium]|nr:L-serine ammonia-lyase, iron-sulfur-dependent, subunit beta [Candidatus Peregrinibacteria bacterium]